MKIILGAKREHYVAGLSILLVAVALIVGMGGCNSQYNLQISSSFGGTVTTPGEGLFKYDKGATVKLVAEPDEDYRFTNWAGNVDSIADPYAATTTITMNNHYSVTARFDCSNCG